MKLTPSLLLLFLLLAACSRQQQLEQRIAELERRIAQLEHSPKVTSPPVSTAALPPEPEKPRTPSPLEFLSWEYQGLKNDNGSNYRYALAFRMKNNGAKDIKLIDGSVSFTDLLGTELLRIRIEPDQKVPAGEFTTNIGEWEVNQFVADQMRMAGMRNKEDIRATLIVRRVVYSDNTTGEFTP